MVWVPGAASQVKGHSLRGHVVLGFVSPKKQWPIAAVYFHVSLVSSCGHISPHTWHPFPWKLSDSAHELPLM